MGEKLQKYHYIILAILLVFGALKTYNSYHRDYPFPYHHDEWQHLGQAMMIAEKGYNIRYDPYFGKERDHKNLEAGFHLFLASLTEFYNIELIFFYQYLASLFFIFSGVAVFVAVSRLTKDNLTGITSLIIFIFLKSNINILGKDFFVPFVMTFPFIFIYLLYFTEFLKENKKTYFYFLVFILLFLIFVYPPSFIILLLPSSVFFIINFKTFKGKKVHLLILFLSLILVFYFFWRGNISSTFKYLFETIYFEPGWGKLEIKYSIPFFYGILNTILAVYGFYLSYHKKELKVFLMFSFFGLAITTIFNLFGFSFLIPYSRAIHYSLISMIPFTALGFNHLMNKFLKKEYLKYLVVLTFFIILFFSKYSLDEEYKEYKELVINQDAYQGLIWLRDNYGSNNTLITPYFMTSAVYPLSGNRVIALIPSQLGGGLIQDNLYFFNYICEKKHEIINMTSADFVLSYVPLDCIFLKEIYSKNFFIYSLQ